MQGHKVSQVNVQEQEKPLTWPVAADIICLFSTTEGYASYRCWLVKAIYLQIKAWLGGWKTNKKTDNLKEIEFHHLLIRINALNGMLQTYFLNLIENK